MDHLLIHAHRIDIVRFASCIALALILAAGAYRWTGKGTLHLPLGVGAAVLDAELASTPRAQLRGLQGRGVLRANAGMLFPLDHEYPVCMWMHDTAVPLSVAFVARDGRIVGVADMQPETNIEHCAPRAVAFALEVPQGWFRAHGVGVGATVRALDCPQSPLPASRLPPCGAR